MLKILVPVGRVEKFRPCRCLCDWFGRQQQGAGRAACVERPVANSFRGVRMFFSHEDIESYYQDSGQESLRSAREQIDKAGQAYVQHVSTGPVGETIAAYAKEQHCDHIVMGSRGLGAVSGMVLGSVATKVIHLTDVPVTLVK